MNSLRKCIFVLFYTSKPVFLILTVVCVFLGVAFALSSGFVLQLKHLSLVIIGAFAAHVAVNVFNEYFDFKSGLDSMTTKTKFSGGSGSLQKFPEMVSLVFTFAILNLIVVLLVALYFFKVYGLIIFLPFIPGVLSIVFYSCFIIKRPFLCLFAPGIGFGFSMIWGIYIALTGSLCPAIVFISLLPFFLVNNLLLLNQFPDMEADSITGRKNLVILYGRRISLQIYRLFMICGVIVIIASSILRYIPFISLTGVLPIIFALAKVEMIKNCLEIRSNLISLLSTNVFVVLSAPSIVGTGLLFSSFR